jgi:uncharacterized protein YraI
MSYSIYVVKSSNGLNIRSGPGTNYAKVGVLAYRQQVNAYEGKSGTDGGKTITWVRINSPSANQWVAQMYLSFSKTVKTSSSSPSAASATVSEGTPTNLSYENEDSVNDYYGGGSTISGTNDSDYETLMKRYLTAFGCPPTFTNDVDPCYYSGFGDTVGHEAARTIFESPSILSICPGTVDYLPGFGSDKYQGKQFMIYLNALAKGDSNLVSKLQDNVQDKLNGKLYEFKSAYTEYIDHVNPLCREAALLMGIGDDLMPGTQTKLKNFDYGYWTTPDSQNGSKGASIFAQTWVNLNTAVSDKHYIHFFVNHQGTSINENMDTQTEASEIEQLFSGTSQLSELASNLQFLFGGAIGSSDAEKDINQIISNMGNKTDWVSSFVKIAHNYLKGGRLVFPQMVSTMSYNKSISCELKFMSPYGRKLSVFLRCIVPAIHLLVFMLPKQLTGNMYTYPFICRVYQQGQFNSDLAVMTDLRLTRGGSDNTSWTVDGLSTEIDASFTITPLYSNLIVPSASDPLLLLNNTSLMEYIGNLCGVDLKLNNLNAKVEIAKSAIENKFTDIPTNLVRGISDKKLFNEIRDFMQITE